VRFDKEITAPPNAGLNIAIKLMFKIHSNHPDITYADLFQLGSATAIEVCRLSYAPCLV
jgi:catalase (peroxidase I)